MAGNRRSWSRGEPTPARPRSGPSRPARHHWAVVPAPARPVAPPGRILAPRGSLMRPRPPAPPPRPHPRPVQEPRPRPWRCPSPRVDPGPDSSEAENGALGGSFRSAPDRVAITTAQSCGNPRAHPMGLPERSSRSAITGNRVTATRPGAPRDPVPTTTPAGAPGLVGRMRRMGLVGATTCPNLLQRHSTAGSAARRSAEYQRFFSGTPARSEPLQQIWTTAGTGLAGWTSVGHLPSGDDTPTAGTVARRARRGVAGTTRSGGVVPAPDHHVTI